MAARACSPPSRSAFIHLATVTGCTPRESATSAWVRPSSPFWIARLRRASFSAAVRDGVCSCMMPDTRLVPSRDE